jgi:hypothetical protein
MAEEPQARQGDPAPPKPAARAPHLRGKAIEALDLPTEERILFARSDRWLGYPRAREALAFMEDLLARPRTTNMPSMLLVGRAGNGKTTILRRFAEAHPPIVRTSGEVTGSVISMELSAGAKETVFWTDLLHACGVAHRETDHVLRKRSQAFSVLGTLNARALQIDEFHNILFGAVGEQRHLLGVIKGVTNLLSVPLIATGTEDATRLLGVDAQLLRRFRQFALPVWKMNDDLRRLLSSFEAVLPLAEPSGLAGDDLSMELMSMGDGTIGSLAEILKEATVHAIRSGRERIDLQVLSKVAPTTKAERQKQASMV